MKKVLVAAFALVSLTASAQEGTLLVGGNVGLSTSKSPGTPNDPKSSSFSIAPLVGYQFNENWTAGVTADFSTSKYTNSSNVVTTKNSGVAVGPFVRYTKTLSNIFSIYGQAQALFGTDKSFGTKYQSSTSVNLFPAVFINIKNGFGLNVDFGGIGFGSNKPTGGSASNSFNVNFGSTANIGITKNFSLGKKK